MRGIPVERNICKPSKPWSWESIGQGTQGTRILIIGSEKKVWQDGWVIEGFKCLEEEYSLYPISTGGHRKCLNSRERAVVLWCWTVGLIVEESRRRETCSDCSCHEPEQRQWLERTERATGNLEKAVRWPKVATPFWGMGKMMVDGFSFRSMEFQEPTWQPNHGPALRFPRAFPPLLCLVKVRAPTIWIPLLWISCLSSRWQEFIIPDVIPVRMGLLKSNFF